MELSGPWLAPLLGEVLGHVKAAKAYGVLAFGHYIQGAACFAAQGSASTAEMVNGYFASTSEALGKIGNAESLVSSAMGLIFFFVPIQPLMVAAYAEMVAAAQVLEGIPGLVELQPAARASRDDAPVNGASKGLAELVRDEIVRAPRGRAVTPRRAPFDVAPWDMGTGLPLSPATPK